MVKTKTLGMDLTELSERDINEEINDIVRDINILEDLKLKRISYSDFEFLTYGLCTASEENLKNNKEALKTIRTFRKEKFGH